VEDEAQVRMLTRLVLERQGYTVLEATTGPEALPLWEQHRGTICLLLTDLVMPGGMDGRELAARLQAQRPGLKVVYTSGYSAEIAGREWPLRPGHNFVQKPVGAEQLLETVRCCLDE
jgi:CheY-like chemotaxis protein